MTYKMMEMLNYYRLLDMLKEGKYIEALAVIRLAVEVAEDEYIQEGDYTAKIAHDWRNSAFDLLAVQFPKMYSEYEVKDRYTDFDRQLSAYLDELGNIIGIIGSAEYIPEDILSDKEVDDIWEVCEKLSALEKYLEEVYNMTEEAYNAFLEYYRPMADLEGFEF